MVGGYYSTSVSVMGNNIVSNTSVSVIRIVHVGVSFTEIEVTLVGFYYDISKHSS